jgi:myo-inositol-1(or 4)-monophosphatase
MSDARTALTDHEVDDLVARALDAAKSAGDLLIRPPATFQVDSKSTPTDIVTEMDRRSENLLVTMLLDGRPDDGVLGEEGSDTKGESGVRWVIDPIDGTANYLYGIPAWAVCIGVEFEGETVAGVVHAPALGETYVGKRSRGAVRFDADGTSARLAVSPQTNLDLALVATGFGYRADRRRAQAGVVAQLLPKIRDIRRAGAASVDLCWLAGGRVDAYYERGLQPWDHCAAGLIAQEAGAVFEGLRHRPASSEFVLAANPVLFVKLHGLLLELDADSD